MNRNMPRFSRRVLLQHTLLTGSAATAAVLLSSCAAPASERPPATNPTLESAPTTPAPAEAPVGASVLVVYFSRAGENYSYGDRIDLEVGNTAVLANKLSALIDCDVYEVEAAEPYSDSYDDTVYRNVREQDADARPAIANLIPSIDQYQTVLLGSPIWNVRPPMIMSTFAESFDFAGKLIHPFVTYAVSGLGSIEDTYGELLPTATFGEPLAVQGETVADSDAAAEAWLGRIGLLA
ncbi:flavodoxin [Agromyces laixinhei]|uniref:flavodoxin n=1 Tax=Agromyces laixinhei TaxID=2585717 RepID=UPI001E4FD3DD|nr:flavodoxin [Agromyces laixinhei]